MPIALGRLRAISTLLFWGFARDGVSTFQLSTASDAIQLPRPRSAHQRPRGSSISVILIAMTVLGVRARATRVKVPLWFISLFAVLFLVAFLAWASAGDTLPVPGLLVGTVGAQRPADLRCARAA